MFRENLYFYNKVDHKKYLEKEVEYNTYIDLLEDEYYDLNIKLKYSFITPKIYKKLNKLRYPRKIYSKQVEKNKSLFLKKKRKYIVEKLQCEKIENPRLHNKQKLRNVAKYWEIADCDDLKCNPTYTPYKKYNINLY